MKKNNKKRRSQEYAQSKLNNSMKFSTFIEKSPSKGSGASSSTQSNTKTKNTPIRNKNDNSAAASASVSATSTPTSHNMISMFQFNNLTDKIYRFTSRKS
jgi:hypothetical protein